MIDTLKQLDDYMNTDYITMGFTILYIGLVLLFTYKLVDITIHVVKKLVKKS
jgi:hypothetical protein